jgi:hypothetical protein
MHIEGRVLASGIEDRLADLRRQRAVLLDFGRWHEAGHAELIEAGDLPIEGTLGSTGLGGAFGRRLVEKDDRADQLVGALARRPRQEFDLAPVLGR